jgi:hypothetical protein
MNDTKRRFKRLEFGQGVLIERVDTLEYDLSYARRIMVNNKKDLEEIKCWIKLHGVSQTPEKPKETGP